VPSRAIFFFEQWSWTVATAIWHGVWCSIINSTCVISDSENVCTVLVSVIEILE
jgi:hypothetical protein